MKKIFNFIKRIFSRKVTIYVATNPFSHCPLPSRQHKHDAGFDIYAASLQFDKLTNCWIYNTGLMLSIPKGCYLELAPRSSIYKTGLIMAHSHGVIDCTYHGEVKVFFRENAPTSCLHPYKVGDRIGQFIIHPYTENVEFVAVDKLPADDDDRKGGFGSTGGFNGEKCFAPPKPPKSGSNIQPPPPQKINVIYTKP